MALAHKKNFKRRKKSNKKKKSKQQRGSSGNVPYHAEQITLCDSFNEQKVCSVEKLEQFLDASHKGASPTKAEKEGQVTGTGDHPRISVHLHHAPPTPHNNDAYIRVELDLHQHNNETEFEENSTTTTTTDASTTTQNLDSAHCAECSESNLDSLYLSLKPLEWYCSSHRSDISSACFVEMKSIHFHCMKHNKPFGFHCMDNHHKIPSNKTKYDKIQQQLYITVLNCFKKWLNKHHFKQSEIFHDLPVKVQKVLNAKKNRYTATDGGNNVYSGFSDLYNNGNGSVSKQIPQQGTFQLDEEGYTFTNRGLRNLGNTCFYNSVIQCLLNTEPLARFYLQLKDPSMDRTERKDIRKLESHGDGYSDLSFWNNSDFDAFSFGDEVKDSTQKVNTKQNSTPQHTTDAASIPADPTSIGQLNKALTHLFRHMYSKDPSSFRPNWLLDELSQFAPQFGGGRQQDSHELLRYLQMLTSSEFTSSENNVIDQAFSFKMRTTVICDHCKACSTRNDDAIDLSVPVPKRKSKTPVVDACGRTFNREKKLFEEFPSHIIDPSRVYDRVKGLGPDEIHLLHCLWGYFTVDYLSEETKNGYLCDKCSYNKSAENNEQESETDEQESSGEDGETESTGEKPSEEQPKSTNQKRSAYLQFSLDSAPRILTVQLKRFEHNGAQTRRNRLSSMIKNDQDITFPKELDLAPFFSAESEYIAGGGSSRYRLYGMVNHLGRSLHSGHYVSVTHQLRLKDGVAAKRCEYFTQSDTNVSQFSEKEMLSQQGYLLFYERIDDPIVQ